VVRLQARIKIDLIEYIIEFNNEQDLEDKIASINITKIHDILAKKFNLKPSQGISDEFKDIANVDNSGRLHLLKFPEKDRDLLKLVLFLCQELTIEEIKQITGIKNPLANMPKEDFPKVGDKYTLQADSRKYVATELIPKLRNR
jgi:hypothetical protein